MICCTTDGVGSYGYSGVGHGLDKSDFHETLSFLLVARSRLIAV